MLAKNVRGVTLSLDMVEAENPSGYGFSGAVVGQCVVALVQFGMWNGSSVDHCFIVSKHE